MGFWLHPGSSAAHPQNGHLGVQKHNVFSAKVYIGCVSSRRERRPEQKHCVFLYKMSIRRAIRRRMARRRVWPPGPRTEEPLNGNPTRSFGKKSIRKRSRTRIQIRFRFVLGLRLGFGVGFGFRFGLEFGLGFYIRIRIRVRFRLGLGLGFGLGF